VKLDDRIVRDFKIGVFIGLRKADRGLHTAFFINGKHTAPRDLEALVVGLKAVPAQVQKAYEDVTRSEAKTKKRKRRKKDASSRPWWPAQLTSFSNSLTYSAVVLVQEKSASIALRRKCSRASGC
jgi:hypothetical protein